MVGVDELGCGDVIVWDGWVELGKAKCLPLSVSYVVKDDDRCWLGGVERRMDECIMHASIPWVGKNSRKQRSKMYKTDSPVRLQMFLPFWRSLHRSITPTYLPYQLALPHLHTHTHTEECNAPVPLLILPFGGRLALLHELRPAACVDQ